MNLMATLLLALFLGLRTVWTHSKDFSTLLDQFQTIILKLVEYVLLPILPLFVGANFCLLSYQGDLSRLWIFLPVILIVILCQYIWLGILYSVAAIYSRKNSWKVLKHYAPAYFTALGTMSSAATLGVALQCAHKSPLLNKNVTDF